MKPATEKRLDQGLRWCAQQLHALYPQQGWDAVDPPAVFKEVLSHICYDTRKLQKKAGAIQLFVAMQGNEHNGFDYIDYALKQGAVVVTDQCRMAVSERVVQVPCARTFYAWITNWWTGHPDTRVKIIGVTGTSGKTSTTWIGYYLFQSALKKVGYIGTIEARYQAMRWSVEHTTPDGGVFHELLQAMVQQGAEYIFCEVSSHALDQKRVHAVAFDAMVFTNLSSEHLDYHESMEDYFLAKASLFTELAQVSRHKGKRAVAVIQTLDPYGKRLFEMLHRSYGAYYAKIASFQEFNGVLTTTSEGIRGVFCQQPFECSLIGEFNVENLKSCLILADFFGIVPKRFLSLQIPGRLEQVCPEVWVDYAHKPDAMRRVLMVMRENYPASRIIVVFGCGGDRDPFKRPVMGQIAWELADVVVVTSDNPRTEDPLQIIEAILRGIDPSSSSKGLFVEPDRRKAIYLALQQKKETMHVMILGKGHETVQIIGKQSSFFSDQRVIQDFYN